MDFDDFKFNFKYSWLLLFKYSWLLLLTIIITFIIFSFSMINPGEVGILVNLLGDNKGIEEKELTVGMHFIAPWKKLYKFPIYEQNHQWTEDESFNFQTFEGLPVSAEIGITYHLEPNKVHELFYKYRKGMEEITHLFIKNHIRDAVNKTASKMKIEELYGPKKEQFFKEIYELAISELDSIGFKISHIYIIGRFNVPTIVMEALNKKIEATQRAQQRENELREAEAEAKKEIALAEGIGKSKIIAAKAEAEANGLLANSLTSEILKWQAINKWNGILPQALGGGDSSFLINLK